MASIPHSGLVAAIEGAVASSGYTIARISTGASQPERFLVSGPGLGSLSIWVYIKNLTAAVRSDPDEYRIQWRSELLPLRLNPSGPTVLLGYHEQSGVFVGFNPLTVSTTARTQISVGYVSLSRVTLARRNGMTFDRDRLGRLAVGVRPEMLLAYCLNASEIHEAADEDVVIQRLNRSATAFRRTTPLRPAGRTDSDLPPERQRLLRNMHVLSRDAGFRHRVLDAYEMRCALTGVQLGLVEAAHILPVSVTGSTDRVNNGLSLLPQFHRAFDSGLIYLVRDFEMRLNQSRLRQLQEQGLGDGLEELSRSLGKIRLPSSRGNWPDPALVREANKARGISVRS